MTPLQRTHRNARLAGVVFLLACGFLPGAILGAHYGRSELRYLIEMPPKSAYFSSTARAVFSKGSEQSVLRWTVYPTPEEASFLRRFPWFNAPPQPALRDPGETPTTTTLPAPPAKELRR